jgi:hypothetical protein
MPAASEGWGVDMISMGVSPALIRERLTGAEMAAKNTKMKKGKSSNNVFSSLESRAWSITRRTKLLIAFLQCSFN